MKTLCDFFRAFQFFLAQCECGKRMPCYVTIILELSVSQWSHMNPRSIYQPHNKKFNRQQRECHMCMELKTRSVTDRAAIDLCPKRVTNSYISLFHNSTSALLTFRRTHQQYQQEQLYKTITLPLILCKRVSWFSTARTKISLKMFDSRVTRIPRPMRQEITKASI
jgi:hypothetical protein